MHDDLRIGDAFVIPAAELEWTFTQSGGPGGQHANRSATRAELRWNIGASEALDPDARDRLMARLGNRARTGVVAVSSDQSRSQWRNRVIARRRLVTLVEDALQERKPRRPTQPTRESRRRRLEQKRRRSELKRLRRPPLDD